MDIKFEDDPYLISFNNVMKADDYVREIQIINTSLERCRATKFDQYLLFSGAMLLPLIPWSIRNKKHKKERKEIMTRCVKEFNHKHPKLVMRWITRPEKQLVIMTKAEAEREMNR